MPALFSDWSRGDDSPMRPDETDFEFYDRVDDPFFEHLRRLLNDWFDRYPDQDKDHLGGRLKSDDQYLSAAWELYLHERFARAGLGVEVDPEIDGGLTPDFRLKLDGRVVGYVEATVDHISHDLQRQARARDCFTHALQTELTSTTHALLCDLDGVGVTRPSLKRLIVDLDDAMAGNAGRQFHRQFVSEDWRVSIRADPLPRLAPMPFVSSTWGSASSYSESRLDPVRGPTVKKGKKYQHLDGPLIVAITTAGHFSPIGREDVANALYGSFTAVLDHDLRSVETRKNPDGALAQRDKPRKVGVSGVVFVQGFAPDFVVSMPPPTLYVNEHARHALEVGALPFTHLNIDPRSHEVSDGWVFGLPEHDLFGLPDDWPGCEPFEEFNRRMAEEAQQASS